MAFDATWSNVPYISSTNTFKFHVSFSFALRLSNSKLHVFATFSFPICYNVKCYIVFNFEFNITQRSKLPCGVNVHRGVHVKGFTEYSLPLDPI